MMSSQATIVTAVRFREHRYRLKAARVDHAIRDCGAMLPLHRHAGKQDWFGVRTVYLDSPDLRCYLQHLHDEPIHWRIRIRRYAVDGQFEGICWVELKVTKDRLSLKRRFPCSLADANRLAGGIGIDGRALLDGRPEMLETYELVRSLIAEHGLGPVVRVDCQRVAFQRPDDPGFRITIDRDIRFCGPTGEGSGAFKDGVIEVKCQEEKPEWLRELRKRLGLKGARRYSKFADSLDDLPQFESDEEPE